ncbi:hypothetical protein DL98DRAFT_53875 [Cadophora sp. DSE1049]|nr:hypothetical protein DL98DRAFT_53875 [Cadophora sp. DSE1049]
MVAAISFSLAAFCFARICTGHIQPLNIEIPRDLTARSQTPTYYGLPKFLGTRTTWCGDTTTGELCLAGNDCIDGQCIPNFDTTIDDPIVYDDPVVGGSSGITSCSASQFECPAGLGCCPIGTLCDDIYGKCCSVDMFCGGICCNTGNICLGDGICGVAPDDSATSTSSPTSSVLVGSGNSSPTTTGEATRSTPTPASENGPAAASGTSSGAVATPSTSNGSSRNMVLPIFAVSIAGGALLL